MKKRYMEPTTSCVRMALQQMIATSDSATINRTETIGNENDVESRRRTSIWDDEDEEY